MGNRGLWQGAVAVVTVFALTGCVKVLADTTVYADDTYSQEIVVAADPQALDQAASQGGAELPEELLSITDDDPFEDLTEQYADSITVSDYTEGDLEGVAISVDRLPLSEFTTAANAATAGAGVEATLTREGDNYIVTIAAGDAADVEQLSAAGGNLAVLESAIDFEIIYRFPGQVSEASAGEVSGNTVTLGLADVLESQDIRIVAGADPSINWGPLLQWGLIALGFIVIIGGAWLLVLQDRRKRHATHLPPPRTQDDA